MRDDDHLPDLRPRDRCRSRADRPPRLPPPWPRLAPAISGLAEYLAKQEQALVLFLAEPPCGLPVPARGPYQVASTRSVLRPADFDPERPDYRSDSYVTLYRARRHRVEAEIRAIRADLVQLRARLAAWQSAENRCLQAS